MLFLLTSILTLLTGLAAARGCQQIQCPFEVCASDQIASMGAIGTQWANIASYRDGWSIQAWLTIFAFNQTCSPGGMYGGWIYVWRVPKNILPASCSVLNNDVNC